MLPICISVFVKVPFHDTLKKTIALMKEVQRIKIMKYDLQQTISKLGTPKQF